MTIDPDDLQPGFRLGHYIIADRVAGGGMGIVYRAFEPALERYVAVKILRPEFASHPDHLNMFQQEARAVAALRHPNIVPIYYIGIEGDLAYFSMPYIHGETFDDWIDRGQWFNAETAHWFLSYAISALDCAFQSQIIHLDIKPANFLIDHTSTILLNDFGLAQKLAAAADSEKSSDEGGFGTPAYVSPEQIYRSKTDQRTDIYSLGATLYHLLVGKPPYPGEDVQEMVLGHLERPFPTETALMARVPRGWVYLIQKMMEKNPDDRFFDYSELYEGLQNVDNYGPESRKTLRITQSLTGVPERVFSVPRTNNNPATLHSLISKNAPDWVVSKAAISESAPRPVNRSVILRAVTDEDRPMRISKMAHTIKELCSPKEGIKDELLYAMEKVPGYAYCMKVLATFMVPDCLNSEPLEVLEAIGYERARNLALTFYAINYEIVSYPEWKFNALWRHQLAVGIILDFMYDALDIRRNGLEYVAGAFHDIGKFLLAELYPELYYKTLARSMLYELPLAKCEKEAFGIDHAELGALWLRDCDVPSSVTTIISQHENPSKVGNRSLVTHALISTNHLAKQIGIGYSGSIILTTSQWDKLPSTKIIWEARRNKTYDFETFVEDFVEPFQAFPDLL